MGADLFLFSREVHFMQWKPKRNKANTSFNFPFHNIDDVLNFHYIIPSLVIPSITLNFQSGISLKPVGLLLHTLIYTLKLTNED